MVVRVAWIYPGPAQGGHGAFPEQLVNGDPEAVRGYGLVLQPKDGVVSHGVFTAGAELVHGVGARHGVGVVKVEVDADRGNPNRLAVVIAAADRHALQRGQ